MDTITSRGRLSNKKPEAPDDEAARMLAETRTYISDFMDAVESASSAQEIIATMSNKWPDHGNPTTLMASAGAADRAKNAA